VSYSFDNCIPERDLNCLVSSPNKITQNPTNLVDQNTDKYRTCVVCKQGYTMNMDGVCEILEFPLCERGQYQGQFAIHTQNLNNALVLHDLVDVNRGCENCSHGYVGYYTTESSDGFKEACSSHQYLYLQKDYKKSSYINNCRNYYKSPSDKNTALCRTCNPDYILSNDNKHCFEQVAFPNCSEVDHALPAYSKCSSCYQGFYLIAGHCEKGTIDNCESYDPSNANGQVCVQCQNNFELSEGQCIEGRIMNCMRYQGDTGNCVACLPQHKLLSTANGSQYCLAMPSSLNCLDYGLVNSKIICETCPANYILSTEAAVQEESLCVVLSPISNCVEYDNTAISLTSTYRCTKCADDYFLKENACEVRMKVTDNCAANSLYNDYCANCVDGFYMTNSRLCEAYPTGIVECVDYQSADICLGCSKNHYLSNNQCVLVPLSKRIENCLNYDTNDACGWCEEGYYLNIDPTSAVTSCIKAEALNCLEYVEGSQGMKCSKCKSGFGFRNDYEKKTLNCIFISSPNCLVNSLLFPFDCKRCQSLYYINNGKCISVTNFVNHCKVYVDSENCQQCEEGYILSHDQQRCFQEKGFLTPLDTCESNIEYQTPICYACKFGYKFDEDRSCVRCEKQTYESGCLYCKERGEEEQCVACKPGYYMNEPNGSCYRNGTVPPN
jgi:hypothetical protein